MTTIITTAASVTKLVTDFPNILNEAVLGAVTSSTSIPASILSNINYGFNSKVDDFFRYGRDYYTRGLPYGSYITSISEQLEDDLLDAINQEIIAINPFAYRAVSIGSALITYPKIAYMVHEYLSLSDDWDLPYSTSSIGIVGSTTGGNLVWQPYVTHIATNTEYVVPKNTATFDSGILHMVMQSTDENADDIILDIPMTYTENTTVYNVIYSKGTNIIGLVEYYFWVYNPASGRHPALTLDENTNQIDEFFPIVPVRIDNVNIVDAPESEALVASCTELTHKIGIDFQKFSEDIQDPNDPTALADVDNAYLMLAMTLDTTTSIGIHYLYEYFRSLYYNNPYRTQAYWIYISSNYTPEDIAYTPGDRNVVFIKDIGIDIQILFNFISIEVKSGLIGDPQPAYDPTVQVVDTGNVIDEGNNGVGEVTVSYQSGTEYEGNPGYFYNDSIVVYRKQLTSVSNGDASNTFIELAVHGLQHDMIVTARTEVIHRTPMTMADGGFFIPLSQDVVKQFNGIDESLIYYESLIFLAYAIEEIKLKWYQEPAFIELVQFIVIVVSIILQAPKLGQAIAKGIAYLLVYIGSLYLTGIILSELFSLIVGLVGGEFALILSAIAAGIAIYYGQDAQFFNKLLTAEDLLKYATVLIEAVKTDTSDKFLELEKEITEFEDQVKEAQDKIDELNDELGSGTTIDLLAYNPPNIYTNFNETPTDFYNRSIHLTNPGVLSLDLISGYVDRALTLPQPI